MNAACIVLTAGSRPAEVARALDSALAQEGSPEVWLVCNGCEPPAVGAGVRVLALPENVGPAAARNRAVEAVRADVLFFLDDDTSYPDRDLVARALSRFDAEPRLGIVSFRIDDPSGRPGQRRHVPRLRAGDPRRSSDATTFLEGACAIRASVFAEVGGYPEEFYFGHEGTDLAWRALDAGYAVRYAGDLAVAHPSEPAERHAWFHRTTARNRVFLARRRLPWLLAPIYVAVWMVLTLARARSLADARALLAGFGAGFREPAGERKPIRWSTVARMTRAGRPPII
ncbi:MAG TPA: glycosyltransferase [Actinomycetota bacterium]